MLSKVEHEKGFITSDQRVTPETINCSYVFDSNLMFSVLFQLQETYTICRRQFGMCEDQIRDVVKSCNQGSCRNSSRKRPSSTSDQGE